MISFKMLDMYADMLVLNILISFSRHQENVLFVFIAVDTSYFLK